MLKIDAHAHIFPDKIADRAAAGIGNFYHMPAHHNGSLSQLLQAEDEAGISRIVAHSVATTPTQVAHINEFILWAHREHPDRIIPFAALHPDVQNIERVVEEIIAAGFRGVKVHPDFQEFQLDEPRALRMFSLLAGRLPVLIHTGDTRYDFSSPRRMANVLDQLPELRAICAHLGGWGDYREARKRLAGRNIHVDTCSTLYHLKPQDAAELIRAFGVERVLFGTDYPMWSPKEEVMRMEALALTAAERERIFYANAQQLFG